MIFGRIMTDNEQQNGPSEDQPQEKTAKQLEKEAKKNAKLEKLKAKLDKKSAAPTVQKDKPEVCFATLQCMIQPILHPHFAFSL